MGDVWLYAMVTFHQVIINKTPWPIFVMCFSFSPGMMLIQFMNKHIIIAILCRVELQQPCYAELIMQ